MSIVAIVIHNSGALIMGDTKLNDNPHVKQLRKIFKKEDVLLGFTGNIGEVNKYLFPIFNPDMSLNTNYQFGNPIQFLNDLDRRFDNAVLNNIQYDIVFVTVIKFNCKYIAKRYCLTDNNDLHVTSDTLISNDVVQYLILGNEGHVDFFDSYIAKHLPADFNDFIYAFQQTLNNGIIFDDTINNIMQYEII